MDAIAQHDLSGRPNLQMPALDDLDQPAIETLIGTYHIIYDPPEYSHASTVARVHRRSEELGRSPLPKVCERGANLCCMCKVPGDTGESPDPKD